ncbi:MAG: triose-phosphate isomerase [Desulfovibrio sp.]|nr:triose-phosphate isomerase [Desulfovibrio sp.]
MQNIIAANWKMHKTRAEAAQCSASLANALGAGTTASGALVLVFAPFTCIDVVAGAFAKTSFLACGGQDCYPAAEGAFTGEISPTMLADAGATWVLTGHSERRHVLGEDDALVARKTTFALEQGLNVMLCIGETLEERENGQLRYVLERQLTSVFDAMPDSLRGDALAGRFAVAYEPVWAIGTGKVAGQAEVLDAHATVRTLLQKLVGATAVDLPILYGGSVKPSNAAGLMSLDNVDGLLVGGASLDAQSFLQIIGA